jgi:hypothetical protein
MVVKIKGGINMYFKTLLDEAMQLFTKPKSFFTGLNKSGKMGSPILKALSYSAAAGILFFLNELIHPKFLNLANSLNELILALIYGIVGLFLGAVVLWLVAMIVGAKPTYLNCITVLAALYPVAVLFTLLGQILSFAGALSWAVMIAAWIYALYLLFCALAYGFGADEKASRTMVGVLVLLVIFVAIVPLIMGFFVKGYQTLRMQANQKMQDMSSRIWRRQPKMAGFGQNPSMMRFPRAQAQNAGMPVNASQFQRVMPSTAMPQNVATVPGANAARTAPNYDMIRKMITSNTKMTAEQKKSALARLEAAQRNQKQAPK